MTEDLHPESEDLRSFIDTDMTDVGPGLLPDNTETPLVVNYAEWSKKRPPKEGYNLHIQFLIPDNADIDPVDVYFPAPAVGDPKINQAKRRISDFCSAFGISMPADPLRLPDALTGARGYAVLGIEDNEQYGRKNRIVRFVRSA